MPRPLPLLPLFLLALLTTQIPMAHAQKPGQAKAVRSKPALPPRGLKPSVPAPVRKAPVTGEGAGEQPSGSGAMRLVVQLGLGYFEFGFATFSSDSRLVATGTVGG